MADLKHEAEAFDQHAQDRVCHGHIPDLRRVQPCDWFYNNPWRRPYLVDMVFGPYFQFALAHLSGPTLLEVGSGVGHMTLEFARNGYMVTGLDLSSGAVEVARQVAAENPWRDGFGSLEYVVADFMTWTPPHLFDNICFFGALHHFVNATQVLERVNNTLRPGGRLVVMEPARDWHRPQDGAIIALIRWLLSLYGGWYESLPVPQNEAEVESFVQQCLWEYQEARDAREAAQSPHDNSAAGTDMLEALRQQFREVAFEPAFAFLHRMCGGVRAESEEKARQIAEFLNLFDRYAVATGLMSPGGFLWAGEKQPGA